MKRIAIIHFQPPELYPPVQNLIRYLEGDAEEAQVYIYTNQMASQRTARFFLDNKNIQIFRLAQSGRELKRIARYWNYIKFYVACIYFLLIKKPQAVLYFETISSYPAIFYKKYIKKSLKLFIHYHEYTSPTEYKNEMILTNYFHNLEKKIIQEADWVSHTNIYRMEMFKKDIAPVKLSHPFILPNFPPSHWKHPSQNLVNQPIKIVYTGAVSLETMFTKEFANWVLAQEGKVIWDIYSLMITDEAKSFFESLSTKFITLKPGIAYEDLPKTTSNYNIGVILYKGHVANYVYNAPNKLFEYLAVGLDVWFPDVVLGTLEYITHNTYPKVLAVDFTKLDKFDLKLAIDRLGYVFKDNQFYCENVLYTLKNKLLDSLN